MYQRAAGQAGILFCEQSNFLPVRCVRDTGHIPPIYL